MKACLLAILLASVCAKAVQFELSEIPPTGLQVRSAAWHLDHDAIELSIKRFMGNSPAGVLATKVRMASLERIVSFESINTLKLPFFFASFDVAFDRVGEMFRLKAHLEKKFIRPPSEEKPTDFQILTLKPNPNMQNPPRNAESLRVAGHGVIVYLRKRISGKRVRGPYLEHNVELQIVLKRGFRLPKTRLLIASSVHHFGTPNLPADRKAKEHHPDFDARYILPKGAVIPEGTAYTDDPRLHFVVPEPIVLKQGPSNPNLKDGVYDAYFPQHDGQRELQGMLDELLSSFLPKSILDQMMQWAKDPVDWMSE